MFSALSRHDCNFNKLHLIFQLRISVKTKKIGTKIMNYFDCHMHCSFSGDSETPPKEMIERALELKLRGICFTDHLDLEYKQSPHLFDLDLPAYEKTMRSLIQEYSSSDFTVYKGLELGMKPGLSNTHKKILSENEFDFVIGSVHVIDDMDPYYPDYYDFKTPKEAYEGYFRCVKDNLSAFSDIDSLGHLDYVHRYGIRHYGKKEGELSYDDFSEIIDDILSFIIKKDIALEVNTGSFRNDMTEPNPSYRIISRYRELGGKIITLGSDAHNPTTIADHFEKVAERLKTIGFKTYLVYEKRTPIEHPL